MLELHNKVLAIKADNKTWTDLCYRIPIADIFLTKRRKKRQIAIGEKPDWYVVSAFIFYDLAIDLFCEFFAYEKIREIEAGNFFREYRLKLK